MTGTRPSFSSDCTGPSRSGRLRPRGQCARALEAAARAEQRQRTLAGTEGCGWDRGSRWRRFPLPRWEERRKGRRRRERRRKRVSREDRSREEQGGVGRGPCRSLHYHHRRRYHHRHHHQDSRRRQRSSRSHLRRKLACTEPQSPKPAACRWRSSASRDEREGRRASHPLREQKRLTAASEETASRQQQQQQRQQRLRPRTPDAREDWNPGSSCPC